jgi:hypothetical protein
MLVLASGELAAAYITAAVAALAVVGSLVTTGLTGRIPARLDGRFHAAARLLTPADLARRNPCLSGRDGATSGVGTLAAMADEAVASGRRFGACAVRLYEGGGVVNGVGGGSLGAAGRLVVSSGAHVSIAPSVCGVATELGR